MLSIRKAAPAALALLVLGLGFAWGQSADQIIYTLAGSELVQVQPANTAAVAYTTVSNLRDGRGYIYNVPLTGFTITMNVRQSAVSLNPAGTLATGTVTLPPTTFDGKFVTIFTTQTITSLTLAVSNTATVNTAVTTLAANATVGYIYSLADNKWYRIL